MINQAPDLTLYLERLGTNSYRGTVHQQWNNIVNLIRKGYKVVTDDGGYGTITEVNNLYIYIDTSNKSSVMHYNNWLQPVLTGETSPLGGSSFAVTQSDYFTETSGEEEKAWKMFSSNASEWQINGVSLTKKYSATWYNPKEIKIKSILVKNHTGSHSAKSVELQGSNDNINWDSLGTTENTNTTSNGTWNLLINKEGWYKYYRILVTPRSTVSLQISRLTISAIENSGSYSDSSDGFLQSSYISGSWSLYVPTMFDISKFIPEPISNTKLIPDLFKELQGYVDEVDDSILRLNYSKDYNKTSNELLYQTLGDLGIEFYEDVSLDTLRRLVQESVPYYIASGRLLALDYIGLSLGVDLRYEQLWTFDYKNFYTKNEIPYEQVDSAYPTNYIRVFYDDLGSNIHENVIRDMFYQLAWVCNIIYDILYAITLETAQEYSNVGLLPNYIMNFKNKDSNMQSRLDEVYRNTFIYPHKVHVS